MEDFLTTGIPPRVREFTQFQEMAAVGELNGPKIGKWYLEIFSREYKHETPHITLELPQKPGKLPIAKIEIKPEQPTVDDEPVFLWIEDGYTLSNALRKAIRIWLTEQDEDGLTGWRNAKKLWDNQAKSISWGQLK